MTDIRVLYTGPIVKRVDAVKLGLKRYFTGKPCKNGHINERVTKKCDCISCISDMNKRQFNKGNNREKSRVKSKEWYSNCDKEHRQSQMARWKVENYGSTSSYWNYYNRSDPEYSRIRVAIWAMENPEKKKAMDRNRRAMVRNSEGSHTSLDVSNILDNQNLRCVYCGGDLSDGYHVDHIMPIVLGGSNWPENLQCLCPTCNLRKGGKHPDEWHKEIGFIG